MGFSNVSININELINVIDPSHVAANRVVFPSNDSPVDATLVEICVINQRTT